MDETAFNSLPVETQEQVNIIDRSKINIILIIAATILSYYATDPVSYTHLTLPTICSV